MEKQNIEHIEDDFLSNLVKKSETAKPSDDFTVKVMTLIPKARPVGTTESEGLRPWHYVGLAAGFIAVVYFIITFDLTSFLNQIAGGESQEGMNYVDMFGTFLNTFRRAFSAFHFTSVSLMIIISIIVLYFGDKLYKKWSKGDTEVTFA